MSTARFMSQLQKLDIELRADGERLVVNAPKGAITEALGDEIRRRKPELIAFLNMGSEASGGSRSHAIVAADLPADAEGFIEAPASFGQRRLFYLDQLDPGLSVYNVPVAYHLLGPCDETSVARALAAIVERHAVLRTTLAARETGVVQRIAPSLSVPLEVADLSADADAASRAARCEQILLARAREPFDLGEGPLFRACLIKLAGEHNVLLLCAHHVVTDGWSQDILEAELLAELDGAASTAALKPLPIRYADYAVWQTNAAGDAARHERLAHWKAALARPLPVLDLPTDHLRPDVTDYQGSTESLLLPADLVEPLSALGRRSDATLFMVLLAAYAVLLQRVTGQDDIVVGTPVANRAHAETLDLVGFFANTLALRLDLSGDPTFPELLTRTREVCVGAFKNQDVPFEELVEVLEVERNLNRSPIFQTIFAFEDAVPGPAKASALHGAVRVVRRETIHAKVARTDLSAWVSATPEGLRVTLEYPTALFEPDSMSRLLDQFHVLLRDLIAHAHAPISALSILSQTERERIVHGFNATEQATVDASVADLIEMQAARRPDRNAVTFADATLSYAELDRRANQLAHQLLARREPAGALIGIFVERSLEMLVSLLAVLKVGAAYVPIDPEYPADRIAHMVEDSGLGLVITSTALRGRLPATVPALLLDQEASQIDARPGTRPDVTSRRDGERPAYVIYTSGSTGKPKGVVVPQRAFVNFLGAMAKRPGISEDDVLVAVTTLSFDIAGLELFLPLTVGAAIVLASAEQAGDGAELRRLLEQSQATMMQATPSTWRLLVGSGWQGSAGFKALCGGEAFPADLAGQMLERTGALFNMYGPTETTVWSTCAKLSRGEKLTIGRPIDNTSIYILDPTGNPTPIAVPGELVIGGRGVALGYLNRPELTHERFVADPFSSVPGAKMYKTGDLASFRADGNVVYHRRLDHQVKVRGYRIELGEIETVLGEHAAIAANVVIVREDRPGDARLCAYFVPRGNAPTTTELRKHLRQRLPDYMLPQHFTELGELPLTPAGKIDRKGLAPPAGSLPKRDDRPPSSPAEQLLAGIWRDALGTDSVFAADNFFEVGGHSLLSMTVIARVQRETGHRFSPRELLEHSLEQLAARLPAQGSKHAAAPVVSPPVAPASEPRSAGFLSRIKGKLFGG